MNRSSALLGALIVALASGCSQRGDEATIPLTSAQQRAVFLATGTPGPQSDVLVMAQVPQARACGGAIELTGGVDLVVVEPQAWRAFTGTALAVEEADRQLARMHDLHAALCALAGSTAQLIEQLRQMQQALPAPPRPQARTRRTAPAPAPTVLPPPCPGATGLRSDAERRDRATIGQGLALAVAASRRASALDAADDRTLASLLEAQAMTRAAASGKPIDYQLALSQAQSRHCAQLRADHDAREAQLRAELVRALSQLAGAPLQPIVALAPAQQASTSGEERHAPAQ